MPKVTMPVNGNLKFWLSAIAAAFLFGGTVYGFDARMRTHEQDMKVTIKLLRAICLHTAKDKVDMAHCNATED